MKAKQAVLTIVAVVVAMTATSASALPGVDFFGYFRDGVGFNGKGGGQACFSLPGTDFKSRLGNECDSYLEIGFGSTLWKDDSGVEFFYQFMPAYDRTGNTTRDNVGSTGLATPGGRVFVQQNWGGVKLPQLGGATIWAGQRYYQRHNIDNLDWFWWNPLQGNGAFGIENVNVGIGKFAFALGRLGPLSDDSLAVTGYPSGNESTYVVPDFRLALDIIPEGSLEVGVDLAFAGKGLGPNAAAVSPWFTVIYHQGGLAGGDNTLAFQYGSAAFSTMSSGVSVYRAPTATDPVGCPACGTTDAKQWRILDQFVYHPIPVFSGELALVYQNKDFDANTGASIFTFQVRPAIHLSDYFKIAADVAYQTVMEKNAPSGTKNPYLLKATLAPTLVAGQKDGLWARPEIRVFATYGAWSNLPAGSMANGVFGTADNGISLGAQMEAWW